MLAPIHQNESINKIRICHANPCLKFCARYLNYFSVTNLGKKQAFLMLQLDPHRTAEKELKIVEQYNWNEIHLTG
jgi:hypothetical protein